ncbi:unnamed protein product [Phytophthora lilii]|uniref:Unnamed protein product n=1 Tax=Phytophthora lilii TaxID=2077276 RepID=A0A9W7DAV4_9STRA|nr:unnamed protein product [Phytophthora lilii]
MTKFSVLTFLLVWMIAIATAQDTSNAGGQAGSVTADPAIPATSPPTTTAPPTNVAPAGVDAAATGAPAAVAAPPAAPASGPAWPANPAPMTGSGSSSFGSDSDIESPVTRKPRTIKDPSRSQPSSPTPTEDSGARTLTTTLGVAALAGLAAML